MSHTETNKNYLSTVEDARNFDMEYIISEAPDNCGHNNSRTFFQGIYSHEIEEEDETQTVDKYLFFGYENEFPYEQITKILTLSNTNDSRTKDTIATKGKGIDLVMYKCSENVLIVSCSDNKTYSYHDFNLKQQLQDCKESDGLKQNTSSNAWADRNTNKKRNCKLHELPDSFRNCLKQLRNCCKSAKVNPPKGLIFLKLRVEEYDQEACDKLMEISKELYSKKYVYKSPGIKIYFLDDDLNPSTNNRDYRITRLEFEDVVYLNKKQDSFTMYIKETKCVRKQIAYFKHEGTERFYTFKSEGSKGRRRFLEEIKENDLKYVNEYKNWTSADCTYSITFYMLDIPSLTSVLKKGKSAALEEAGIYLMTHKDRILISKKPLTPNEIIGKKIEKVGGFRFRGLVEIYDKKQFGFRPVKSETKINAEIRRCIKDIYLILYDAHYNQYWENTSIQEVTRLEYIGSNKIFDIVRNRKETLKKKETKKQIASTTGELYAHFIRLLDNTTITKFGINKNNRGAAREKEIMKKFKRGKLEMTIRIRNIPQSKNVEIENMIKNYCKHDRTIELLEHDGHTTERIKSTYKEYNNFTLRYKKIQNIIEKYRERNPESTLKEIWGEESMSKIKKLWV